MLLAIEDRNASVALMLLVEVAEGLGRGNTVLLLGDLGPRR